MWRGQSGFVARIGEVRHGPALESADDNHGRAHDNFMDSIAHYRITAKLGEGGMGAIYRATDTNLNRDVAAKILPDAFADDPDRLARFARGAQVLASMNHPNIAAIYGVEEKTSSIKSNHGGAAPTQRAIASSVALSDCGRHGAWRIPASSPTSRSRRTALRRAARECGGSQRVGARDLRAELVRRGEAEAAVGAQTQAHE
jgi:hypothetical protein